MAASSEGLDCPNPRNENRIQIAGKYERGLCRAKRGRLGYSWWDSSEISGSRSQIFREHDADGGAIGVLAVMQERNKKMKDREQFEQINVFGTGEPNTGFARYFTGESFFNPLTDPKACPLFLANVTFEPGCRNNWHIHHASKGGGQLLICTAGEGWYQEEGKEAVSLDPGSIIVIPANVKHWHGAKADSWFSHIACELPGEECSTEWCEAVTDEEYHRL